MQPDDKYPRIVRILIVSIGAVAAWMLIGGIAWTATATVKYLGGW